MNRKAAKSFSLSSYRPQVFYRSVVEALNESGIPYMVGGGYALELYTGISRKTKDLDLFVSPAVVEVTLKTFAESHYETELTFPHWLGKIFCGRDYIDVIFCSGNGVCPVDDGWFEHAVAGKVFDVPVIYCPPEELVWTKAFVMERERYDGADVAHLLRACAGTLDWRRLLERFGSNWRVLLSHLVLFGFVYPSEQSLVPTWLMEELMNRLRVERSDPLSRNQVCRGTLLSRSQYRDDVESWGYEDARQLPGGPMSAEDAANWTAAGDAEQLRIK